MAKLKCIKIVKREVPGYEAQYVAGEDGKPGFWQVADKDGKLKRVEWLEFLRVYRTKGKLAALEVELRAGFDKIQLPNEEAVGAGSPV